MICDNLKAHLTPKIQKILKDNHIRLFTFPPHSTHLLQALDLCFFGVMKAAYTSYQPVVFSTNDKMGRKIEKIMKAYHSASYPLTIFNGWKEGGIEIDFSAPMTQSIKLNRMRVLQKIIK